MTHQAYLSNQADDLKTAVTEDELIAADLERLRRRRQDPYGCRAASDAHARDFAQVQVEARNRGEGWAR